MDDPLLWSAALAWQAWTALPPGLRWCAVAAAVAAWGMGVVIRFVDGRGA